MIHQGHVLYKIEITASGTLHKKIASPSIYTVVGSMPDHTPDTRHTTATEAWVKDDHDITMEGSWQDVIPVKDTRKYACHNNKVSL